MHAALRTARTAPARPAPPLVATPPTPDTTLRTNDDARRRKDAACPHGHKAGDADRWGTATLGDRPCNGELALFLSCERGSHRHTASSQGPASALCLNYCTRKPQNKSPAAAGRYKPALRAKPSIRRRPTRNHRPWDSPQWRRGAFSSNPAKKEGRLLSYSQCEIAKSPRPWPNIPARECAGTKISRLLRWAARNSPFLPPGDQTPALSLPL